MNAVGWLARGFARTVAWLHVWVTSPAFGRVLRVLAGTMPLGPNLPPR